MTKMPTFPGWHPLGRYPQGDPDGVGSWLLHHGGQALLLEIPPGLTAKTVNQGLRVVGSTLKYVTASHRHWDHFDEATWAKLRTAFSSAEFIRPAKGQPLERQLDLGGEVVWRLAAPKHSPSDAVTIFRGVAMTGDIELGQLASCNREVPAAVKAATMARIAGFPERSGYGIHTTISAHVNDVRIGVDWRGLFTM